MIIKTVISAFYYLKLIKTIYFDEPIISYDNNSNFGLRLTLFLSTSILILFFIYPNSITEFVKYINII